MNTWNVYDVLAGEWDRIGDTPAAVACLDRWAMIAPELAGHHSPHHLVAAITADREWGRTDPRLAGLVRLATDPFAARTVLQAVLPGLRAEPLRRARYHTPLAGPGDDLEDVSAELVAAAWEVIRTRAGTVIADPENVIVRAAAEKLRTRRRAEARTRARTVPLATEPAGSVEIADARTSAERVLAVLVEAVAAGTLTARQAELVYATRVQRIPGRRAGRAHDMTAGQVFYTVGQAEDSLRRSLA